MCFFLTSVVFGVIVTYRKSSPVRKHYQSLLTSTYPVYLNFPFILAARSLSCCLYSVVYIAQNDTRYVHEVVLLSIEFLLHPLTKKHFYRCFTDTPLDRLELQSNF